MFRHDVIRDPGLENFGTTQVEDLFRWQKNYVSGYSSFSPYINQLSANALRKSQLDKTFVQKTAETKKMVKKLSSKLVNKKEEIERNYSSTRLCVC